MSDSERQGGDEFTPSIGALHVETSPETKALDAVVREAKELLVVREPGASTHARQDPSAELDWDRLEARVMASIEKEKPALLLDVEAARARSGLFSREGALRTGALLLSIAAGIALFVRKDRDVAWIDVVPGSVERAPASALRATDGVGEARIEGVVATPGYVVREGDSVDVERVRAVFERSRKVVWFVEQQKPDATDAARVHVKEAGEPLVLSLESGAVEAQVAPVERGEAFAVDIETERGIVRVAVHGTHLRVARSGSHVVVDLTEGVVSIGVPPRKGSTYGTIVTAPAHVEFDADDLTSLRVDHAPSSVRAAVPLGNFDHAPPPPRTEPTVASSASSEEPPPPSPQTPAKEPPSSPQGKPEPTREPSSPRDVIFAAVRACATGRGRADDVRVSVTSSLRLRISSSGRVESAQFSPPLSPDIQACASKTIYKTKFSEKGLVTIPIEFSY